MKMASIDKSVVKCVAFDVFGTLVHITKKHRPFRKLVAIASQTAPIKADVDLLLMGNPVGLLAATKLLKTNIPLEILSTLELELYDELASIEIYPEVAETLKQLKNAGYKIALCSNLALPYSLPVKILLPFEPDYSAWSFNCRALKPEREIYKILCKGVDCPPDQILFVGDTVEADYTGPTKFGMQALHLSRGEPSPVSNTISSLDQLLPMLLPTELKTKL